MEDRDHRDGASATYHAASDLTKARRDATWGRVLGIIGLCIGIFGLIIGTITVVSSHPAVLVYTTQGDGSLQYMGQATTNGLTPSEFAIDAAIAKWAQCFGDIPGKDSPELVTRNAQCVLSMTQSGSNAYTMFQQAWGHDENPIQLGASGITRSVDDASAHHISGNSYQVTFVEITRRSGTVIDRHPAQGTVTLAGPPEISTDPNVAMLNPAGIHVADYDIPWATVEQ